MEKTPANEAEKTEKEEEKVKPNPKKKKKLKKRKKKQNLGSQSSGDEERGGRVPGVRYRISSIGVPTKHKERPKLGFTPASALDVELKKVLLNDSMATVAQETKTKSKHRKLDLLDLARSEAEVIDIMRGFGDDKPEEEEEKSCWRRAKKKLSKDEPDSDQDDVLHISKDDVLMTRTQRIAKWMVHLVAIFDVILSAQDTFTILTRKMQIEYLFMSQIYNCDKMFGNGDIWLIWADCIHCLFSATLLYMEDKNTSDFGIYWLVCQSIRTCLMILEAFFRSRFKPHFFKTFFSFLWWRLPIDLIQMGIVLFRYYKLNNPFPQRLRALATEIHLDRPLNNELRLRDSTFLQSKFRLREAAAFQTLEIIRKVRKTRKAFRDVVIGAEIIKAFQVLRNPKRYPMKQTIADTKVKRENLDNLDNKTIFEDKSIGSLAATPKSSILHRRPDSTMRVKILEPGEVTPVSTKK